MNQFRLEINNARIDIRALLFLGKRLRGEIKTKKIAFCTTDRPAQSTGRALANRIERDHNPATQRFLIRQFVARATNFAFAGANGRIPIKRLRSNEKIAIFTRKQVVR